MKISSVYTYEVKREHAQKQDIRQDEDRKSVLQRLFYYGAQVVQWIISLPVLVFKRLASIIKRNPAAQQVAAAAEGASSPTLESRKVAALDHKQTLSTKKH